MKIEVVESLLVIVDREAGMQELQEQENARIKQATQEALRYVEGNIFPAAAGDRCGDDRSEEKGLLAIFGASTGFAAALVAEGVSPVKSRDVIKEINQADGVTLYYFHDDETGHTCGHEGLLSGEHASEYGVTQSEMAELKQQNNQDLERGLAHKETYKGPHQAARVIRVHSRGFTVRSNDGTERNFVVDVDRIREKAYRVARTAGVEGQKLFDRIIEHTNITASYLAEDLDAFDAYINDKGEIEKVEYGGKIPPPQKPEQAA